MINTEKKEVKENSTVWITGSKLKILGTFIGLAGFIGSMWFELGRGEVPCPFCLTIRYSLLASAALFIVSIFLRKAAYLLPIPLVISLVADIILISNELKASSDVETGICGPETVCKTPEFLGINLSLWALILIIPAFAVALQCIKEEKNKKK